MRRLVAWIGGAVGGFAAYRLVRQRVAIAPRPDSPAAEPDERAEELRAKLAEARGEDSPVEASEPAPSESLEERRRQVHEEGRAAIDEMQSE